MRESGSPAKQDLILKAAAEVFSTRGFHGARIEEIARQAGVGKGTVYEYFKSKEHLFSETLKAGMEKFNQRLLEETGRHDCAREKLASFALLHILFGKRYRSMARMAMLGTLPLDESFRKRVRQLHAQRLEMIENIVKEGIAGGEIRPVDPFLAANLFYGGVGLIAGPFVELAPAEIERSVERIIDYFFRGIAARDTEFVPPVV
ncbi:MAG: TetR/AcrR family transcriptional regulator [Peptococcaceae bacterium]|jgi:TetR/AcrR family fatty acid metabolism transcriptional regulator|nr:TetR/AcrR family transcriptional regulator [Peptococcaceae bacterium]MDH7524817.1 TetR/AcrR family transcriptional regulator [Peptococcaceae bacterium]